MKIKPFLAAAVLYFPIFHNKPILILELGENLLNRKHTQVVIRLHIVLVPHKNLLTGL